jgi:tRNA dimethylallyltransferase
MDPKFLIVIAGPTAAGKTALAIEVAKELHTAVISADSRQLFREMQVGTARPTENEMQGVTHYMMGSNSIEEDYNVGRYEAEVMQLLDQLFKEKDAVVLCGGSGLYIDAVCNGLDELPQADESTREMLSALLEEKGLPALQEMLKEKDPAYYDQVDLQNPHRLIRALEVCIISGQPYSQLRKGKRAQRNFRTIKIGVSMERSLLYERINQRVDEMMSNGFLEEAKRVYPFRDRNALQTVGYKELFDHLDGRTDLNTAVSLIKQNTRRFAKRQLTWFRRDEEITWFEPGQAKEVMELIRRELRIKN